MLNNKYETITPSLLTHWWYTTWEVSLSIICYTGKTWHEIRGHTVHNSCFGVDLQHASGVVPDNEYGMEQSTFLGLGRAIKAPFVNFASGTFSIWFNSCIHINIWEVWSMQPGEAYHFKQNNQSRKRCNVLLLTILCAWNYLPIVISGSKLVVRVVGPAAVEICIVGSAVTGESE